MVAEANKNSTSEKAPEEAGEGTQPVVTAKVGDGGKPPKAPRKLHVPHGPKVSQKGKLLIAAILAVIIVGGGWFIAKNVFHVGEKVYAQAAGHKIYKKEIDALKGNTKGISDRDVAKVLADKYLYEAMAKKAGIKVSDQDVAAQFPGISRKSVNAYVWQDDVNSVYANQLMAYNTGLYKGEVLVAYFNRYVPFQSSLLAEREAETPLIGNKAAISADKKYAHDFITKMYDQLKSGQITFDDAVQAEKSDPRLGPRVYGLPHSGPFDTSNVSLPGTALVGPKSAQPEMASIKAGQLSKPFIVSVRNSWKDQKSTAPAYYLVVRMDYSKGSHSGLSWEKYLGQQKNKYHYKVFAQNQ